MLNEIESGVGPLANKCRVAILRVAMVEIKTQAVGITFDSSFKKVVLFKNANCDEIAAKCLDALAGHGLKPRAIRVRFGDLALNYDVTFSLFNGNATFSVSSERLRIEFQNASTRRDSEIVTDCVVKFYEHVPLPEIASTLVTANAHVLARVPDEARGFLARYADPKQGISSGGIIAYLRCDAWPQELRLTVEKSLSLPDGMFLAWTTNTPGQKISHELLSQLRTAAAESVTKVGLVFASTET